MKHKKTRYILFTFGVIICICISYYLASITMDFTETLTITDENNNSIEKNKYTLIDRISMTSVYLIPVGIGYYLLIGGGILNIELGDDYC